MKMALFVPSAWQRRISIGFGVFCVVLWLLALGLIFIAVEDSAAILLERIEALASSIILALLATLLIYHRPENVIGWLLALATLLRMAGLVDVIINVMRPEGSPLTVAFVIVSNMFIWWSGLTYTLIAFIIVLFPNGKLPSARWRVVLWLLGLQVVLTFGQILFLSFDLARHFAAAEAAGEPVQLIPLAVSGPISMAYHVRQIPAINSISVSMGLIALSMVVLGLISQVHRFRSGNFVQRQQIKWVIFAMVIWGGLIPLLFVPVDIPLEILALGFIPVPISVTLAIFRYRLYEIDIIINQTLVYGSLSAALLAVYFTSVVFFETLSRNLTGARSPLATVLATLIVAAIFQPLRRRLQAVIDRAFFRRKYDAQQTLEAFAGFFRDEVSMYRLTDAFMGAVSETLQPVRLLMMVDLQQESTGTTDLSTKSGA